MDLAVRRRIPRERSHVNEKHDAVTVVESSSYSGISSLLAAVFAHLVQLLKGLFFSTTNQSTRHKEHHVQEEAAKEELVLLGHLCKGAIAVHERRRGRKLALTLSSSETGTPSSLKHAAAAYSFLAVEKRHARLLTCLTPGPPIVLEHASLGTVAGLLSTTTCYPSLSHPAIPSTHSTLALPLSWLLQTASALGFLHDHKVTHGALSPSSLYLRHDLSLAIADFTRSTINGHNNGIPTRLPSDFAFPVDALRYDYFDGELSANSQALGLAIDAFDFATLSFVLLVREKASWELPTGNGTWALEELHEALDQRAPELGDEIVLGYVVRDAWCLVYEEGKTMREDVVHALTRHGFSIVQDGGDEVVGVGEAVGQFAAGYRACWEF